jgi:hypothetical protein
VTRARRIQALRSRWRTVRWAYRQRNLAHGAWARFREALALAAEAYAIDADTVAALAGEGYPLDHRGEGLEPPRRIVWITAPRAAALARPRLMLRLDATLLASPWLALVAFEDRRASP